MRARVRRRGAAFLALWLVGLAGLLAPLVVRAQEARLESIALTMPSVVTVLSVDVENGELQPMAGGSGTIVDSSGAILTNHHVMVDPSRMHHYDLFLIGRFRAADREPELVCAGVPRAGILRPDLDLALIRCDRDLNGQPWWPEFWPAVPLGDSKGIVPGEQVWVLGYPSAGGSAIRVSAGLVSGWTGEHGGASSRAFMRTDAAISAGNSGGTAADRFGRLIGVPTAYRAFTAERGTVTSIGKVGLIRPIELALELIATGRRGWPDPDEPAPAAGPDEPLPADPSGQLVLVAGSVTDASSLRPVRGAHVVALKPGISDPSALVASPLGDAVAAWSQSDATGRFVLEPPLPRGQRYTVGVMAKGYELALEISALEVPNDGVHRLLPWRTIALKRAGSI